MTSSEAFKDEVIGESKPGLNIQGYCQNSLKACLAARSKSSIWINLGYNQTENEFFIIEKNSTNFYLCPSCKEEKIGSIHTIQINNAEYSIKNYKDKNKKKYSGNTFTFIYPFDQLNDDDLMIKVKKIKQHATSLEDLIEKCKNAMNSPNVNNLLNELEKYEDITIIKPDFEFK